MPLRVLALLVLICGLSGCSGCQPSLAADLGSRINFWDSDLRTDILANADEALTLASATQHGQNISTFTAGWFVEGVLTQLSSQDPALATHFGGDVISYLKGPFSQAPEQEIAYLDKIIGQGNEPRAGARQAARWALEALRAIPDSDDPPDLQQKDRQNFTTALQSLATALKNFAGPEGKNKP